MNGDKVKIDFELGFTYNEKRSLVLLILFGR